MAPAGCDQSTCPYPAQGNDRCNPYPFYCCNKQTKQCETWDGEDQAAKCPSGPYMAWDGLQKVRMTAV